MTRASQSRLQRRSVKRHESQASLPPTELQADAVQVPASRFPHGVVAVIWHVVDTRGSRHVRWAQTVESEHPISTKATAWALEQPLEGRKKLPLLAIAHEANRSGACSLSQENPDY
jgi:hypothetical protein